VALEILMALILMLVEVLDFVRGVVVQLLTARLQELRAVAGDLFQLAVRALLLTQEVAVEGVLNLEFVLLRRLADRLLHVREAAEKVLVRMLNVILEFFAGRIILLLRFLRELLQMFDGLLQRGRIRVGRMLGGRQIVAQRLGIVFDRLLALREPLRRLLNKLLQLSILLARAVAFLPDVLQQRLLRVLQFLHPLFGRLFEFLKFLVEVGNEADDLRAMLADVGKGLFGGIVFHEPAFLTAPTRRI
jgi:hypothetical protein